MKSKMMHNKKGILMSLLVIVLFVLMLGEVMTYVLLNINYSIIAQSASLSSIQGTQAATLKLSMASFLHSSLSTALYALATYEGTPSVRKSFFVNNTKYALTSLIMNGTLYGISLNSYMGNLTIANFNSSTEKQFTSEGLGLTLNPGSNLTIFQTNPGVINATYSVLATITGAGSSYTVPISVTTGLPLNGTTDLSSMFRTVPLTIAISHNISAATRFTINGVANAVSGSTGPFSFAFGTIVYISGTPTCSSIPTGETTSNYILSTVNAFKLPSNVCGMGGLIANTPLSANSAGYTVPYLMYPSSILQGTGTFTNGTQVLLNGPTLAVYTLTPVQSAIQTNKYFTSPYLPNYLDSAQGPLVSRASGGLFSFSQVNRVTPDFSTIQFSSGNGGGTICIIWDGVTTCYGPGNNAIVNLPANIVVPPNNVILPPVFTISFWINPYSIGTHSQVIGEPSVSDFDIDIETSNTFGAIGGHSYQLGLDYIDSIGNPHSSVYNTIQTIQPNAWSHVALVFGPATLTWYINGANVVSYSGVVNPSKNTNSFVMGSYGATPSFNGMLSDVQVYNTSLSPFQVQTLYREGISGWPSVAPANLVAWYPLDGNANDYSGYGRNGASSFIFYSPLRGYYGDPVYQNAFTNFNTSEVEGVLNCGNINQCTQNLQHFYIGGMPLEVNSSGAVNETAALGLKGALIPDVLSFAPGELTPSTYRSGYVQEKSPLSWLTNGLGSYSISIWVYPTFSSGTILQETNSTGSIANPFISIEGGTGYIGYKGTSSLQCGSIGTIALNSWSDISVTYNGATGNDLLSGYVNGVNVYSTAESSNPRNSLTYNAFYNLGQASASSACGGGAVLSFSGLMSSFQVYNTVLSSTQVQTLYQNNTVNTAPVQTPALWMPLSAPYTNANSTAEKISKNYGVFYTNGNGGAPCSVGYVLNGGCALSFTPP